MVIVKDPVIMHAEAGKVFIVIPHHIYNRRRRQVPKNYTPKSSTNAENFLKSF